MTDDDWQRHARDELAPKIASSAYVITIEPGEIDPKVALETGYAVLLGKPILLVVPPGRRVTPGLARVATHVVRMRSSLATDAGQVQLRAAMAELERKASRS